MPNQNTISRLVGVGSGSQGTLAIPLVSPTTTSAFAVTNQLGNPAILNVGSGANPVAASQGGAGVDGLAFKLRLIGKATTTQSCNITAAIQLANSTTAVSSNLRVATTGALALNTASGNFQLEASCVWDSASNKLSGFQVGTGIDQSLVSVAALTGTTNLNSVATSLPLQFIPVLTASATTGTTIAIDEFTAEVL